MKNLKLIFASFVIILLIACGGEQDPDLTGSNGPAHTMVFRGIAEPTTDADKRLVKSSSLVTINGKDHQIDFETLIRTGKSIGRETFGLIKDKNGDGLTFKDGSPYICRNTSGPDHTSLITFEDELFAITHLECPVGGAYVMKLEQDSKGKLSVDSMKAVDFSGVFGTYLGCGGMTTAWGTHLGSEEYEPPMGIMSAAGTFPQSINWHEAHMQGIAQYHKLERTPEISKHIGYYQGWIPEITITDTDGDTSVAKHYSMGRFSHELAYVMPDNKTVYLSDDGKRTGFFMFIADEAKDLSAGNLYAAKWIQETSKGAGGATLEWISLGHATNADIEAKLKDMSYTFDSMWKKANVDSNGGCPSGYKSVNSGDEGLMCLQLIESEAKFASRLETRLYAAYRGATTEFNKEEGITYNADHKRLYVAMSNIENGMEDFMKKAKPNDKYDKGGNNDIRLQYNACGSIYGLDIVENKKDFIGNAIDSNYVATNMYSELEGQQVDYSGSKYADNLCNINSISNPDNLSYLPKYGILLIGEDTKTNQIDKMWAYDVNLKKLTKIISTPYGSETTSPYWHTNINGFAYLTTVVQHPYGETDKDKSQSAKDKESYVGYVGPFPALDK